MVFQPALTLTAAILIPLAALATDCRFTLADQSNWSANTGFYLDLENTPSGASTFCTLQNMTIAVGVADGSRSWLELPGGTIYCDQRSQGQTPSERRT